MSRWYVEWYDRKNKKEMALNYAEIIKIYNKYTDICLVLDNIMSCNKMEMRSKNVLQIILQSIRQGHVAHSRLLVYVCYVSSGGSEQ
jgi:hypothetical protein